jgi:small subunit ribosomal protein S18
VKHYEGMFVLHNRELPEGDTASHEEVVRTLIQRAGGETATLVLWANRKLAYSIAGNQTGTYVLAYFSGPSETCQMLNREVSLSDRCLRHLALQIEALPTPDQIPGPLTEPTARPMRRSEGEGGDDGLGLGMGGMGGMGGGMNAPVIEESAAAAAGEEPTEKEKKVWEQLDYKNVYVLRRLITSQGKVFSRVRSNLHAKHQRQLRTAVLRARMVALLPFVAR